MASDKVIHLNSANFQSTINSSTPVLVDFWAPWCGPCRSVAPILDELAEELDGKLTVAKVDIDNNQAIASQFQVNGIPAFMLFQNGEVKDRMMGAMPKSAFQKFINRHL